MALIEISVTVFRLEEYLPDNLKPYYDNFRAHLLDGLANVGLISKSIIEQSDRPGVQNGFRFLRLELTSLNECTDINKARSAYQAAESSLKEVQDRLTTERAALDRDWGPDWAWKKLEGQCIEKNTGEYTYELCWFGKTSQKSNKNHGSTNLG